MHIRTSVKHEMLSTPHFRQNSAPFAADSALAFSLVCKRQKGPVSALTPYPQPPNVRAGPTFGKRHLPLNRSETAKRRFLGDEPAF